CRISFTRLRSAATRITSDGRRHMSFKSKLSAAFATTIMAASMLLLSGATAARADVITFTLENVVFTDNTSATGMFTYDSTRHIATPDITTTDGVIFGATYLMPSEVQFVVHCLRDCVRLLPTLRADAIGKKLQIRRRRRFGQLHPSRRAKCKGVRFSCEQAWAWLQPRLRGRRSLRPAPRCVGGWQRAGRRASIRFTAVSKPCVNAWGN